MLRPGDSRDSGQGIVGVGLGVGLGVGAKVAVLVGRFVAVAVGAALPGPWIPGRKAVQGVPSFDGVARAVGDVVSLGEGRGVSVCMGVIGPTETGVVVMATAVRSGSRVRRRASATEKTARLMKKTARVIRRDRVIKGSTPL